MSRNELFKTEHPASVWVFSDFLEYLRRQGFNVSVDHYVLVRALLEKIDYDVELDNLKTLICPIIADSDSQQEQFYRAFDAYVDVLRQPATRPTEAPDEVVNEDSAGQSEPGRSSLLRTTSWVPGLALLALLALSYGSGLWQGSADIPPVSVPSLIVSPPVQPQVGDEPLLGVVPSPEPPQAATPVPEPDAGSYWMTLLITILFTLILWAGVEYYLFKRRQRALEKQINKKPILVTSVSAEATGQKIFESPLFYKTARLMRGRQITPSNRLDAKATVIATAKAAGYPTLRFEQRSALPEYLILIARSSFHDHQAAFFDELTQALIKENLYIERFFYDGDPRLCYDAKQEKSLSLFELQLYFPRHRLLIFSDGDEMINPIVGGPMSWTMLLNYWNDRALLTPRDVKLWGEKEITLAEQFKVVPATIAGLTRLAEHFEFGLRGTQASITHSQASGILQHSDETENIKGLRHQLGEKTFQWLCACAIYPELQWGLTLYLGFLPFLDGDTVTEENLLRLVQLKWFRDGFIPDEVREKLIYELKPETRALVRESIIKLLETKPLREITATRTVGLKENLEADTYELTLATQRWLYYLDRGRLRSKKKKEASFPNELFKIKPNPLLDVDLPQPAPTRFQQAGVPYLDRNVVLRLLFVLAFSIVLAKASPEIAPFILTQPDGDSQQNANNVNATQQPNINRTNTDTQMASNQANVRPANSNTRTIAGQRNTNNSNQPGPDVVQPPNIAVPTRVTNSTFLSNLPRGFAPPGADDTIGQTLLAEYGAMLLTRNGAVPPPTLMFESEAAAANWQASLSTSKADVNGVMVELQTPALAALLEARREAQAVNLDITPRGGPEASKRSYNDTVRLWNSRILPGLTYWVSKGRISEADAARIKGLAIRAQVQEILRLETQGIFFSKDFSKSVLYSIAPPGTSQHLSMLAFDVMEFSDSRVRSILAKHGWFQTVLSDLPHFTYLGVTEDQLPSLGLEKRSSGNQTFWVPAQN